MATMEMIMKVTRMSLRTTRSIVSQRIKLLSLISSQVSTTVSGLWCNTTKMAHNTKQQLLPPGLFDAAGVDIFRFLIYFI